MIIYKNRLNKELKKGEYFIKLNDYEYIIKYKSNEFKIKIDNSYPFKPPLCYLKNGNMINNYNPQHFPKKLWKMYNESNKCMCCNNISCLEIWSPSQSFYEIIDEYINFVEKLKNIYKKHIFKNISLPNDLIYYILLYL
jgi:hypothetical protein